MKEDRDITENYPCNPGPVTLKDIRVLRGANYYSGGPVIYMKVSLNEYDEVFTNQIGGFYEDLAMALPTLIEHHCSEGMRGGFFTRLKDGTLLGHVIEHVAIELQTLAGMDVSFGKTRSALTQGEYNIVFRFYNEYAGVHAGKAAINLVNSLLLHQPFNVMDVVAQLIAFRKSRDFSYFIEAMIHEASEMQIPCMHIEKLNMIQFGSGRYQQRISSDLHSTPEKTDHQLHDALSYLQSLFIDLEKDHIPLISVTGSKGKTMCTELIARGLEAMGMKTALSNSNGVFYDNVKSDCLVDSENPHAKHLLQNPNIDIAVCETPVESIFASGLSYQLADMGVVLNVNDDCLRELDVKRIDDLAYAKSVVAEEVRTDGFTLLNADEDLVVEMSTRLYSQVAWFSSVRNSSRTLKLLSSNVIIAINDGKELKIYRNGQNVFDICIKNSSFLNFENKIYESVNATILALFLLGVDKDIINQVLN